MTIISLDATLVDAGCCDVRTLARFLASGLEKKSNSVRFGGGSLRFFVDGPMMIGRKIPTQECSANSTFLSLAGAPIKAIRRVEKFNGRSPLILTGICKSNTQATNGSGARYHDNRRVPPHISGHSSPLSVEGAGVRASVVACEFSFRLGPP